jgi:hypothetical protein
MEQQQDIRELRRLLNESLQDMKEATQREEYGIIGVTND